MINRLLNHIHRFLAQDLSEFKADIANLFISAINSIKLIPVVMEDKRLNINQPLLSVRRLSPKAASQKNDSRKFGSYLPTMPPNIEPSKTEFKLDPLKNTGSIPFVWEHSPGRPKDDESHKQIQTKEYPLGLPKLPPGRISKPRKKDSDYNITQDHIHIHAHTSVTKDRSSLQTVFQTEEKVSRFDRSKSIRKEIRSDSSEGDDNNNETFMDALDTLSRGDQSSFYNCSTSGVNVNVNSSHESDVMNTSGILRSDPKLRDFMMGRFIPAAKAMATETQTPHHHHSSRKQIFRDNHPREVKKLANMENKKLQLRYGPMFLQDKKEEEEEDSDHEYYGHDYEHENTSFKFCGLLPRFCSKGSLNLVGPVPGIGMRSSMRTSRTYASSNSLGSFIEIEKRSLTRSHLVKHQDSINETSTQSRNFNYNYNHNHPKLEGSKLYNRLQGCGFSESFHSPVSENESSSSCSQKKRLSFKELLNDKNSLKNERVRDNQDSIIEKTLYVDTENSIPSNLKQENTDTQGHVETEVVDQSPKDSEDSAAAYENPAPPPLPKSPSDSWLGRTLPSVSSKQSTTIRWNPRFRPSDMLAAETESDKTTPLRIPKGPLLPIPES